jgi:hypothetical protein
VVIDAGAASPCFGALKFLRSGAALLAETTDPSVKVLTGDGAGATALIDANGNAGIVMLITVAPTGQGTCSQSPMGMPTRPSAIRSSPPRTQPRSRWPGTAI